MSGHEHTVGQQQAVSAMQDATQLTHLTHLSPMDMAAISQHAHVAAAVAASGGDMNLQGAGHLQPMPAGQMAQMANGMDPQQQALVLQQLSTLGHVQYFLPSLLGYFQPGHTPAGTSGSGIPVGMNPTDVLATAATVSHHQMGKQDDNAAAAVGAQQQRGEGYTYDELTAREKKKLEQNREAAKRFRARKKIHIQTLEHEVQHLKTQLSQLKARRVLPASGGGTAARAGLPEPVAALLKWWPLLQPRIAAVQQCLKGEPAPQKLKVATAALEAHVQQFPQLVQLALQARCLLPLLNGQHWPRAHRAQCWLGVWQPSQHAVAAQLLLAAAPGDAEQQQQAARVVALLKSVEGNEQVIQQAFDTSRAALLHSIAALDHAGGQQAASTKLLDLATLVSQALALLQMVQAQLKALLTEPQYAACLIAPFSALAIAGSLLQLSPAETEPPPVHAPAVPTPPPAAAEAALPPPAMPLLSKAMPLLPEQPQMALAGVDLRALSAGMSQQMAQLQPLSMLAAQGLDSSQLPVPPLAHLPVGTVTGAPPPQPTTSMSHSLAPALAEGSAVPEPALAAAGSSAPLSLLAAPALHPATLAPAGGEAAAGIGTTAPKE